MQNWLWFSHVQEPRPKLASAICKSKLASAIALRLGGSVLIWCMTDGRLQTGFVAFNGLSCLVLI
jgi:hypothetical protein